MPANARLWNPGLAQAEAVLGAIESGARVQQRHQFFVWMQAYLGALVPHDVAICGAYNRNRKALGFEVFSSLVLPLNLLDCFSAPGSAAMDALTQAWVAQGGSAQSWSLEQLGAVTPSLPLEPLRAAGLQRVLIHGVSRPQHAARLETLFVLLTPEHSRSAEVLHMLTLLMPHLHATWLRVRALELSQAGLGATSAAPARSTSTAIEPLTLTARELEILGLVRQGLSNRDIGDALAISALTVKNHAQNIFRKLGVSNRTQAVSRALSRHWLADKELPPQAAG